MQSSEKAAGSESQAPNQDSGGSDETQIPTEPDHDRPTDPAPAPSSLPPALEPSVPPVVHPPLSDSFEDPLPTTPPAAGPVKVGPNGALVPATKAEAASRDWLDWSIDGPSSNGRPRLRVKGLVDAYTPPPAPDPDDGAGPNGWRERHRRLKTAMAEHDQTTIGKIMEQPLDLLHSQAPAEVSPVDFDALEACIKLELAEWGRATFPKRQVPVGFERRWDGVFAIRVVFSPIEQPLEARLTPRDLTRYWKSANGSARLAAERMVRATTAALHEARSGERDVLTVPDVPVC